MDTNYWYYTLSAIPQTLGAIIALSATFVVFKLNFISEKIKDSRTDLRRFILLLTSYQHKEIHDIESTILDGAHGLALAAETAIGKHPFEAINMIQKVVAHVAPVAQELPERNKELADILEKREYLQSSAGRASSSAPPARPAPFFDRCAHAPAPPLFDS